MLKRVNIQYSIDLEELPTEIDRIYSKAKNIFNGINLPQESGEELLTADVLKKLDTIRRDLTCLDHALSDVSGIVGSYVEYEISKLTAAQTSTQDTAQNAENATQMSE
jgi:hypothetical protein|tara:strand:- start:913 stop:1236 length:324 start_codon:yes stop_codon:yes gene_type:complete